MFFLMLVNLGLGSMFGTIEGILTPLIDTFKVRKELLTGRGLMIVFLNICSVSICNMSFVVAARAKVSRNACKTITTPTGNTFKDTVDV